MRKSQKRQIVNMIALLDKAQDALKKALDTGNGESALSLLEQCQDSAIQIGGMIEEALGEDFATVGLLENYCEQLYQTYELIRQKHPINANKTHKSLRKELIRIENSVKNDIQVRTTAVFLPYKASMWDSLESVWKAADEDPNCDAYVVPIPYFDKNPDGSFREMHYEGNEYPKYVPITSWETYDLAAEHPDMIFIHNPYDEFNHVTSVPPAYYSKELKNVTDMLIYIPYYILGGINPDNPKSVEKMQHFCTVPAVVYADKVIVQSKAWRQVYIDVMTQTMGKDTKQVWEDKILALGSPKLDKVHTTGRDDVEIPQEWRKIIEKPDGSRKKIIFYNTSVSALLQHSEKMLEKMNYVFRVFHENQDEVALLWRPHPLIQATIESMRPQLWAEYVKIIKIYREEGWGIYDDTVDINRAIALSDAYYGDPSSIVKMYEETGKPIMMQNVEVTNHGKGNVLERNSLNLHFRSYVRIENKVYFSESFFNGLFELDLSNYSAKFICHFSEEYKTRMLLHGTASQYEDKLFFFPVCSRHIHCYELRTQKESVVVIPIAEGKEFLVTKTIKRGNRVWLFSSDPSIDIYVFDMEDQSVINAEILNGLLSKYKPLAGILNIPEEQKVFCYCKSDPMILEIDLEELQIREYRVKTDNYNMYLLGGSSENFYLQDVITGDLYSWNRNSLGVRKLQVQDKEQVMEKGILFGGCCVVDENCYMIPWKNKFVLKSDERILKKAFDYPDSLQRCDLGRTDTDYVPGMINAWDMIGKKILFYPYGTNQLIIYDTVTEEVDVRRITTDVHKVFPCSGIVRESNSLTLEYFCNAIKKSEETNVIVDKSVGEIIYHSVCI